MSYHVLDKDLIRSMDNEPIPDDQQSHLRACTTCHNRFKELLSISNQFEELVAATIPAEIPHSDLFAIKLRRRLARVTVIEESVARLHIVNSSLDQNIQRTSEIAKAPGTDNQPAKKDAKRSFKLLQLPQGGHHLKTPMACSVTFIDGDNLFRKGHRAFTEGSMEQAIEYWREAKMVFLRLGFTKEIAACDRNVAVAQKLLGQSEQALDQFRKARKLFKKIGEIKAMNSCDLKIRELLKETTGRTWA